MKIVFNKATKFLLIILTLIAVVAIVTARNYYADVNSAEDPRVLRAKELRKDYERYIADNDKEKVLEILSEIDTIYNSVSHYEKSYERGVVLADKAAVYINMALFSSNDSMIMLDNFMQAHSLLIESKNIYKNWDTYWGGMSEAGKIKQINTEFSFDSENIEAIKEKRVSQIKEAQKENVKRKSVVYANLGIIYRHTFDFERAAACYDSALTFWPENHTAKNNLRILAGLKPVKRSVLKQIFGEQKEE